ncbi:unnamed protein product [Bemisia tabaci]|uniref:CWH43-like N-terminal domain-containing protein n=1 Tax=Bemisia tabaci TaxID=7038 RepID=A0A9P0AAD1_BEMTA|nr:PREDICTED: post-GPI attachment to proteins factor 2-like [Bemisia tabaci]CAH0387182.1 unnamed protein product [Bemisia tabaci]
MDTIDLTEKFLRVADSLNVFYSLSISKLAIFTVACPLIALFTCFITAVIYQFDDVHETHCRVFNIVPSISAVTGVSPQRYLWRASIALHLAPRLLLASLYYTYYGERLTDVEASRDMGQILRTVCYWLNVVEIFSLAGVTYISNIDNYPIHEKLFITFMTTSLTYMLFTLKLFRITHPEMNQVNQKSYRWKRTFFTLSIICTVGLVIFFMQHRLLCHNLAFSWFAACEYVVAASNMAFHFTCIYEFPDEYLFVTSTPSKTKKTIKNSTDTPSSPTKTKKTNKKLV